MQTPRVFCCSDRIAKRFARHNLSVGVQCETFLAKRHAPKLQFLRGADDMDRACRRVAKTCHTCAAVPPKALKAWFQNAVKTSQDQLMSRKLKVAIFHCGESAPWPWTWLTKSFRIQVVHTLRYFLQRSCNFPLFKICMTMYDLTLRPALKPERWPASIWHIALHASGEASSLRGCASATCPEKAQSTPWSCDVMCLPVLVGIVVHCGANKEINAVIQR
jgi:hypothetical protein